MQMRIITNWDGVICLMRGEVAVEVCGLCVARGDRWVLQGLDVDVEASRLTVVAGANGSGKSTFLEVLAGLRPAAAGSVEHRAPRRRAGRPDVAYVPQHTPESATVPLTVREVVSMGRWAARGPWRRLDREDRAVVADAMELLDVTDLGRRRLDSLSGGQRQRALVARAVAQQASVMLLDEPTTGLDDRSRDRLVSGLLRCAEVGTAVLAATHDEQLAGRASRCLAMDGGRLADRDAASGPAVTAAAG